MKSFLAYKFTSCSSSYIGETCCHFKTRIEEHIKKDNKSHIFKHLHSTTTCFDSYNSPLFKIVDKANSKFDLKINKTLHIRACPKYFVNDCLEAVSYFSLVPDPFKLDLFHNFCNSKDFVTVLT